jgi:hypothetical protein
MRAAHVFIYIIRFGVGRVISGMVIIMFIGCIMFSFDTLMCRSMVFILQEAAQYLRCLTHGGNDCHLGRASSMASCPLLIFLFPLSRGSTPHVGMVTPSGACSLRRAVIRTLRACLCLIRTLLAIFSSQISRADHVCAFCVC